MKKMKKIKLFFTMAVLAYGLQAHAQISLDDSASPNNLNSQVNNEIINSVVKYNAAIVGYAQVCNLSTADAQKVENDFYKRLDSLKISSEQNKMARQLFMATKSKIRQQSAGNMTFECETFSKEFKSIVRAIE